MTRWLILKHDYGQLGNRLHTHANALAFAIEHDLNLLNLSFTTYAHHFPPYQSHPVNRFHPHNQLLRHLLLFPKTIPFLDRLALSDRLLAKLGDNLLTIERNDEEALEETDLIQALQHSAQARSILIRAWDIQCPQALKKHGSEIRRILTPREETCSTVSDLISSLPTHDILVGLHARRGDYATWQNGRHYHSWEQYADWLRQTHSLLRQTGRKPAYLLCSDECPPPEVFSPYPVAIEPRPLMTDLHALSTCQLLLGPPSSFGTWAAFYGDVPRLCLQKNEPITSLPLRPHS